MNGSPLQLLILPNVPTHNKHIFVRSKKCAYYYYEKSAYLGKSAYFGKWRLSHLRYRQYRIDSKLRKYRLFIFPETSSSPNKHIFEFRKA